MRDLIACSIEDVDKEILVDLQESIGNEFSGVEMSLMALHQDQDPQASLSQVLQFLKSIEAAVQQTFIEPYVAYIHTVEDLLTTVSLGRLPITEHLSELLLLALDQVRVACDSLLYQDHFDHQIMQQLSNQLNKLTAVSKSKAPQLIVESMQLFASKVHPDLTYCVSELPVSTTVTEKGDDQPRQISREILQFLEKGESVNMDDAMRDITDEQRQALAVFEGLAGAVELRSELWRGRTAKVLYGCLLINRQLPAALQVDELQLRAASYMHDVYMSLLPDNILFKQDRYGPTDIMLLQQHPIQAYEMLRLMPGWQQAADMAHQHHERYDGRGYPLGIKGDEIHIGAQIIALSDAFFAITHQRADRQYHKSIVRATLELNKGRGSQFSPLVLDALNKVAALLWPASMDAERADVERLSLAE
ncbi:HD domain-containing protein [Dasania sp. GY-MA-18]|uniref:HD domain-containing protein n=1 Tax=Dasania phycosphaerae TaxID=2950436 RepID=A0A9J6RHS3_9GAMM|nr:MULTISPECIES: HD domain-containing phosphohydrolase [Dasania]MCR8921486.1 HD domain-containing protein [Dasania sp. GY-MA-18]MCZ0863914.1 HD domain-containing protein [Dasania phycosphaerae]MCZ0867642.1 HD domain-containing protein [Dasania phycosphaerae]